MYHGYTESPEKIEERKRRILGTVKPVEPSPVERISRWLKQPITTATGIKQMLLMIAILYPAAFFIGDLLGRILQGILQR